MWKLIRLILESNIHNLVILANISQCSKKLSHYAPKCDELTMICIFFKNKINKISNDIYGYVEYKKITVSQIYYIGYDKYINIDAVSHNWTNRLSGKIKNGQPMGEWKRLSRYAPDEGYIEFNNGEITRQIDSKSRYIIVVEPGVYDILFVYHGEDPFKLYADTNKKYYIFEEYIGDIKYRKVIYDNGEISDSNGKKSTRHFNNPHEFTTAMYDIHNENPHLDIPRF